MKLVGWPARFVGSGQSIHFFHRVSLGLESRTRVHLVAAERRPGPDSGEEGERPPHSFPDIVISTIQPAQWPTLWRMHLRLREASGAVASVLAALRATINIPIIETLTTEARFHEIDAVIDLKKVEKLPADVSQEDADAYVQELLADAKLLVPASLHLQPMTRLRELASPHSIEGEVVRGRLKVTEEDLDALFRRVDPTHEAGSRPSRVMMYSDTEEKLLYFHFPTDDQCLMKIAIEHAERRGAISQFCDVFKEEGANILNSYSRLQTSDRRAEWYAITDVSKCSSVKHLVEKISRKEACHKISKLEMSYIREAPSLKRTRFGRRCPFRYTDAVSAPEMFRGRKAILKGIVSVSEERISGSPLEENHLIAGYTKTGKSSILGRIERMLELDAATLVVRLNLSGFVDPYRFCVQFIEDVFTRLEPTAKEQIREFLSGKSAGDAVKKLGVSAIDLKALRLEFGGQHSEASYDELPRAMERLEEACVSRGVLSVVVLMDEANDFLNAPEFETLRRSWLPILEKFRFCRWIVASSGEWRSEDKNKGSSGDEFSARLKSKLLSHVLGPLDTAAATSLIVETFSEDGSIRVLDAPVRTILRATGTYPAYIQAVCSEIWKILEEAPRVVDVVTTRDVEVATKKAARLLGDHFAAVHRDLQYAIGEKDCARLIRGCSKWKRELREEKRPSRVKLRSRVIGREFPSGVLAGKGSLTALPILLAWADLVGV